MDVMKNARLTISLDELRSTIIYSPKSGLELGKSRYRGVTKRTKLQLKICFYRGAKGVRVGVEGGIWGGEGGLTGGGEGTGAPRLGLGGGGGCERAGKG